MNFIKIASRSSLTRGVIIGLTPLCGLVQCSSQEMVLSRGTLFEGVEGPTMGGIAAGGGPDPGTGLCVVHADCPPFSLCQDGSCVACPTPPAVCSGSCTFNFFPLFAERNGCTICECVPPSECLSDADCQPWEICYPGAQCADGCMHPSCCAGNQCAQPGCQPPWVATSCAVAGCPSGTSCVSECEREQCDCNGVDWVCVGSIGGIATTSCAWNCAAL